MKNISLLCTKVLEMLQFMMISLKRRNRDIQMSLNIQQKRRTLFFCSIIIINQNSILQINSNLLKTPPLQTIEIIPILVLLLDALLEVYYLSQFLFSSCAELKRTEDNLLRLMMIFFQKQSIRLVLKTINSIKKKQEIILVRFVSMINAMYFYLVYITSIPNASSHGSREMQYALSVEGNQIRGC